MTPPTEINPPGQLVIAVDRAYNWVVDACEGPEVRNRIEATLSEWLRRPVTVRFDRPPEELPSAGRVATAAARDATLKDDPMIRQVVELFEARAVRVEVDDESAR